MGTLFGANYPTPEPIDIKTTPVITENEPEARSIRDAERRKIAGRRGSSSTILTSPLGAGGNAKLGSNILDSSF